MKEKKLIKFNGGSAGHKYNAGKGGTFYIAAYSTAEAIRLYEHLTNTAGASEINKYYHKGAWSNSMNGIEPECPCVYFTKDWQTKPKLLLTLKNNIYEHH